MSYSTKPYKLFNTSDKIGITGLAVFAVYCAVMIVQIVEKSGAF